MSTSQWRANTGLAALFAGIIGLLGITSLMLFFGLEMESDGFHFFGFLSDLLPPFAALLAMTVVVVLYQMERESAPQLRFFVAFLGIAANLILLFSGVLYLFGSIDLDQQIQWFFMAMAVSGSWYLLVNTLARRARLLPSALTNFGRVIGVTQLVHFFVFYVLDGYNALFSPVSPLSMAENAPVYLFFVIGVGVSLIGYIGSPIWHIWLGRWLLGRQAPAVAQVAVR